jgi:hypothetical protein
LLELHRVKNKRSGDEKIEKEKRIYNRSKATTTTTIAKTATKETRRKK